MDKKCSNYNLRYSSFTKPSKYVKEDHNHSMKMNIQSNRLLKLKSNNLFAFQNDCKYSSVYNESYNIEEDFINHDWTNNSNFYGSNLDKSNIWLQVNMEELNFKHKYEDINYKFNCLNKSNNEDICKEESVCSISSEIEKNLDFLNEIYEDDLNEAKLSLDELLEVDNDCQTLNNSTNNHFFYNNEINAFRSCSSFSKRIFDKKNRNVPCKVINNLNGKNNILNTVKVNTVNNTNINKINFKSNNNFSDNHEFTSTQSLDISENTISNNNYSSFKYNNNQMSSQNLFKRSSQIPFTNLNSNINFYVKNNRSNLNLYNNTTYYNNIKLNTNQKTQVYNNLINNTNFNNKQYTTPFNMSSVYNNINNSNNLIFNSRTSTGLGLNFNQNSFTTDNCLQLSSNNFINFNKKLVSNINSSSKITCNNTNNLIKNSIYNNNTNNNKNESKKSNNIKENINNRSITHMTNINLNSLLNFHAEEKYILDNIDKLLTDQNGCRVLQKKLDEKNKDFLLLFYDKIKTKVNQIINNQFGNYLMQKFLDCCFLLDISLLNELVDIIKNRLLEHSNDPYGSRVIQKLLDLLNKNIIYFIDFNNYNKKHFLQNTNNNNNINYSNSNNNLINLNHNLTQSNINNCSNTSLPIMNNNSNNVNNVNNVSNVNNIINKLQLNLTNNINSTTNTNNNNHINQIVNNYDNFQNFNEYNYSKINENYCNIVDTIIYYLVKNVISLSIDINGNHVLQKVLILSKNYKSSIILDEIVKNLIELSKLKQGASIIQKAIECGNDSIKNLIGIKLANNIDKLVNDEYGNFVIQIIINLKILEVNEIIYDYISKNIAKLSIKKYASNVIDKDVNSINSNLQNDNIKLRNNLIDVLIKNNVTSKIIGDQYGNYIIQKALKVSDGIRFLNIIQSIKPCLTNLKTNSYGKKIYDILIKQYGEYFSNNEKNNASFENENKREKS